MRKDNSIAKGIGAILIAGVLAAGVCCAGFASRDDSGKWFHNSDLKSWHWSDKTDDKKPDDPDDKPAGDTAEKGGAVISDSKGNGITLLSAAIPVSAYEANGVSAQAENAFVLTATITPANTSYKHITWAVRWKNAASSWAKGKTVTDYVSIIEKSTAVNNEVVVVSCVKGFSEQIEILCSATDKPEISALTVVDYVKRVSNCTFALSDGTHNDRNTIEINDGNTYTVVADYSLSEGTLSPTFEFSCTIGLSDIYYVEGDDQNNIHCTPYVFGTSFASTGLIQQLNSVITNEKFVSSYRAKNPDGSANDFVIYGTYSIKYGGKVYETGSMPRVGFKADIGSIWVFPSGVTVDNTHIIF